MSAAEDAHLKLLRSRIYVRVRLKIIRNELIKNVCKCQSCMVSTLRILFKRTRMYSLAKTNDGIRSALNAQDSVQIVRLQIDRVADVCL